MKETDLQFHIKQSVIKDGGYCKKLTNRFTIGIPDLVIILSPFAPCFAEVKELGECIDNFDRQLDVTPKQQLELDKMSAAAGQEVSFILVGLVWRGERMLMGLPRSHTRLSAALMQERPGWGSPRRTGSYYNVCAIMFGLNLARI